MKLRTITLSLLALLSAALPARAEDPAAYPTHKIRMLLPYAAGGGGDVIGRLLGDKMGKTLGQSVYIENHTGAAGTLGTQMVAASANDGYTITVGGMTTHVLAPAIYPKLPYDSIKDFTTIGRIGTSSIMLVATKDFAANDIKGLIALAKKRRTDPVWKLGRGLDRTILRGNPDAADRNQDGSRAVQRHR
ncbi:tripartite-type tricarboxylate transporter receptor subunit TctC [Bradyrhizobium sp. LB7.2]